MSLYLLLILVLGRPALGGTEEAPSTWDRAKQLRAEDVVLPSQERRLALGRLVVDLLRAAPSGRLPPTLPSRAEALGLRLEQQGDVVLLGEAGPPYRGEGLVAVRLGPVAAEVVLQAPHPFYDKHTGAIVGAMLDDLATVEPGAGALRAIFLATAHRHAGDADPAHAVAHPLQGLSDAADLALPDALVVQLHGFSEATTDADAVVSAGSARSGGRLEERARLLLREVPGLDDLRGPDDVPDLAATTNVQGRMLADRTRFLHLELDLDVREALRRDPAVRARLLAVLAALANREPLP